MSKQLSMQGQLSKNISLIYALLMAMIVSLLLTISVSWQSWQRNTSLAELTSFSSYFFAIWLSYLSWIGFALLIYRWHRGIPVFSQQRPSWWLVHLGLSISVGIVHLALDTVLLWLSLSQSFQFLSGFAEKLIRWLPYELLMYWGCLSAFYLFSQGRSAEPDEQGTYLDKIPVKRADELQLIPVLKVDYFEAFDNYIKVWQGTERDLIKDTMAALESSLNPKYFVRIHRSYLVNLSAIDGVSQTSNAHAKVRLRSGTSLPISRRRKAELNRRLLSITTD